MPLAESMQEMEEWSPEQCRRNVSGALPQLISQYQLSKDWTEDIRMFNFVTEMFLPHVSLDEMEESIFSQILPKADKLFDDLICEISSQASSLSSQNVELKTSLRSILQTMVQWLKAFTACVHHVCSLSQPITLESIRSLPASVLRVLHAAFSHCKDSDTVYSGRLHLVSDLLQAVFKEAVSLQKQLVELLDKTTVTTGISDNETSDMASVLHSVLDICAVVSNMDHALHANTWKFIIKQSLKHQTAIKGHLRHNDVINGLCDDILLSFYSCVQLAEHMTLSVTPEMTDQKLFQKTVKLCRFFANSLVHYSKEFMPFLSQSCNRLHKLYLQIHSQFPPSLSAVSISEIHKNEISNVFLVVLDQLFLQFLPFRAFVDVVLHDKLDLPPEHSFPHCLLLINLMDKLPSLPEDVILVWCSGSRSVEESSRMSVFRALFKSFTLCSPEVAMPLVMQDVVLKGQQPSNITFYQYVCVHLCAFIISLPPTCFSELEVALLDAVLSPSMMSSLLAMDSWCFLARYETAELCAHHICVLAHVVKSLPGECYMSTPITVLLRRLLFLMSAEHQLEFIKMFPPEEVENFTIWQHLSLSALPAPLRVQVNADLLTAGIAQSSSWLDGERTLKDLLQLNSSLSAILTACSSSGEPLDAEHQSAVKGIVGRLWPLLNVNQIISEPILQQTLCVILPISTFIAETMESPLLTQIISLLSCLSKEKPQAHVQLAMLEFLSGLGKVFIPHEAQTAVLPKISGIFSVLLADKSWLIQQHALEAFTRFAEETSHEDVVPQSLHAEETKNKVIAFLNKSLPTAEPESTKLERVKEEKKILDAWFARTTTRRVEESGETSAKRFRHSDTIVQQFDVHIQSAENALTNMQSLLQHVPAPDWLSERLYNMQALLTTLQKSCLPNNT
ncbi:FIGNL1-interacting regulator of recombination and mitosis [Pelobates fuscus]|uniref:FIGNL1-interacting regulator of recombination and mitosis n=1 Tax=Pelobates fuscus TaxID=191477 RepID=UPI002FE4C766